MTGFFSKLFGGGKKKETAGSATGIVEDTLQGLMEKSGFDLQFNVSTNGAGNEEDITIEFSGSDEGLLTEKEGAVLDAIQLYIKRVIQHHLPESRANVSIDCNGFREETNRSLVELADKLRDRAIEQGRSVYLRALPPKDRKVVHQHLATDARVRSRSVGDGLYKKIKIYPVKGSKEDTRASDIS